MPIPGADYEELVARNAAAADVSAHVRFRAMLRTLFWCWLWSGLGMFLVGWAFHTTNSYYGHIAFWLGLGVGNGGVLFTLVGAWRKAEARGDYGPPD